MTFFNRIGKSGLAPWLAIFVLAGGIWIGWQSLTNSSAEPKSNTSATQVNDANRAAYASLYDALWRQDDGRDSLLVTATLFTPELRRRLGDDTGRSETEQQLWRAIDDLTDRQAAAVVTFDNIGQPLTDAAIQAALRLSFDETASDQPDWQGLIATPRVVNAPSGTSSQIGVAVFSFSENINWAETATARLIVTNLGGRETREFSWSASALTELVEAE